MGKIVYQIAGQPVSIVHPCNCDLTVEQIGQKDVPFGTPFWIVDEAQIPTDRSMRDAWVIDESKLGPPHGNGGTYVLGVEQ